MSDEYFGDAILGHDNKIMLVGYTNGFSTNGGIYVVCTDSIGSSPCNSLSSSMSASGFGSSFYGGVQITSPSTFTSIPSPNVSVISVAPTTICSSIGIDIFQASSQKVDIYPNPTTGILNIETQNKNAELRITNLVGEQIIAPSAFGISPTGEKTIDLSTIQNGIYFVSVKTSEGLVTKKIIVQH